MYQQIPFLNVNSQLQSPVSTTSCVLMLNLSAFLLLVSVTGVSLQLLIVCDFVLPRIYLIAQAQSPAQVGLYWDFPLL